MGKKIFAILSLSLLVMWVFNIPLGFNGYFVSYLLCFLIPLVVALFVEKEIIYDSELVNKFLTFVIGMVIGVVVLILINFTTSPLFTAEKNAAQIGNIKEIEFSSLLDKVDFTTLVTKDEKYARILAAQTMGSDSSVGSLYSLGEGTIQVYKGKVVWIFPLEHRGAIKSFLNGTTPGYVIVSATNETYSELIKNRKLKILESCLFGNDRDFVLWKNGISKIYKDITFELDDNGIPVYTATVLEPKIGLMGEDVVGLAVLNAETGEYKFYKKGTEPEFADRIIPVNLVQSQLSRYGAYRNGYQFFNSIGKIKLTEGITYFYNKGEFYYYTGYTSSGSDRNIGGFFITNSNTKETFNVKLSGAEEMAAVEAVLGKVKEKNFNGGMPTITNLNGVPTYFLPLTDSNGVNQMYAFCSVKNFTVSGISENIQDAKAKYVKALSSTGEVVSVDNTQKNSVFRTIDKIENYVLDGNSFILFKTKEDDTIYNVGVSVNPKILFLKEGNKVQITFNKTESSIQDVETIIEVKEKK